MQLNSENPEPKPICQIITPVGMLGYGFDEALTHYELSRLVPTGIPTAIILDSGSTDSGPQKLALGSMSCPRSAYAKDLAKLLRLVHRFRVPLIFGSAGGDGTDEHVKAMGEIIEEIAAEEENKDYSFNTISLFSNIDKTTILERLEQGRLTGCGPCVPPATELEVNESLRVVAQMGYEPFFDAMTANPGFNIIIGGRAYDPSPYVAFCVYQLTRQSNHLSTEELHSRLGGFYHMGKILECGGQCSFPKSHGAVATVYENGLFDVRPTDPQSICTSLSVAAHTLYENTRPDVLRGPGGSLHLDHSKYEQLSDGKSVRIDKLLARVKVYVDQQHPEITGQWNLDFHVYGKDQYTQAGPGQLFIVAEALAPTQQLANSIASKARVGMIHAPYPGQKATAGNFGFGLGGLMEIELGPCAEFSLYHLMDLEPGEERLALGGDGSVLEGSLLRGVVSRIGKGFMNGATGTNGHNTVSEVDSKPPQRTSISPQLSPSPPNQAIQKPETLSDLCRIVRSKNAGPYEITIDAMFASEEAYEAVKSSDLLSPSNVAKAIGISEEDIIWIGFFDPAISFKVTIPRIRSGKKKSAGGFMENDIHGSQEHMGLASLKLPEGFNL
ncbi:hypothetical protein FPRO05_08302 [Fusarium proliferatum]|uniref:Caib baif family enzyme n=1 Tax=Gibberella intermedia TaxID=948311 RepID=A0A365NJ75_GIBIN|nr:hypothetical protein FPRO05_08302 [Fusarium proliferatum]